MLMVRALRCGRKASTREVMAVQIHYIAMLALLALGCSSSSSGTGATDASVDMRVDTDNHDGPASEAAVCTGCRPHRDAPPRALRVGFGVRSMTLAST
jgi:hypothetical protein